MESIGLSQLDEIRSPVQGGFGKPLAVNQVLPLADHAQSAVVEDHGDDGQAVVLHGAQLMAVHAEAAVTGNVDHPLVRVAHLGADGGAQAEAHGAEAAGGQELTGIVEM